MRTTKGAKHPHKTPSRKTTKTHLHAQLPSKRLPETNREYKNPVPSEHLKKRVKVKTFFEFCHIVLENPPAGFCGMDSVASVFWVASRIFAHYCKTEAEHGLACPAFLYSFTRVFTASVARVMPPGSLFNPCVAAHRPGDLPRSFRAHRCHFRSVRERLAAYLNAASTAAVRLFDVFLTPRKETHQNYPKAGVNASALKRAAHYRQARNGQNRTKHDKPCRPKVQARELVDK